MAAKVVYLAGHGRVAAGESVSVPAGVTLHWLGHLGDVSNGISYAFLKGQLQTELEPTGHGMSVHEHYLCGERADIDPVTDTKLKSFLERASAHPQGDGDPYILYPRGKVNVSLTSIIQFVQMLSPSREWHLYWTCCRGYIGIKNPLTSMFDKASSTVQRVPRSDPAVTPKLDAQEHVTKKAGFDSIRMIAKSDRAVIDRESQFTADGKKRFMADQLTQAIENLLVARV